MRSSLRIGVRSKTRNQSFCGFDIAISGFLDGLFYFDLESIDYTSLLQDIGQLKVTRWHGNSNVEGPVISRRGLVYFDSYSLNSGHFNFLFCSLSRANPYLDGSFAARNGSGINPRAAISASLAKGGGKLASSKLVATNN